MWASVTEMETAGMGEAEGNLHRDTGGCKKEETELFVLVLWYHDNLEMDFSNLKYVCVPCQGKNF